MKILPLGRFAAALAAAGLLLGLAAPAPQGVGLGEEVAHTFR